VDPKADSETLLELLAQWDELHQRGQTPTPEELCPHDARLQALLRERVARRMRLCAVLDLPHATVRDSSSVPPAPLPVIDGYEIGDLLGRGGMGLVFKAVHKSMKRQVALKIVISGAHAGAVERARFRTEAEAVARLHAPGIVQIYEVGEQAGCPYLAMEFVAGGSLERYLDGTPMPQRRAAQMVLDLARAVQHAHEQGIVHRDLKPANVLLTEAGATKIADFGLAKLLDAEQGHTRTGDVLGSPSYMAPEQAAGNLRAIGPATDVYALGAILYELLTGRPPFLGASCLETLDQVRNHDPAPPQSLQPNISGDLEVICLKCLEKRPAERYPTAAALARDLDLFLRGETITARKLTPLQQAARLLRHSQLDANWGAWANVTFCLAPLPLLAHSAVFVLLKDRPEYAPAALGVSLVMNAILICWLFFGNRASLRAIAPIQRRRYLANWGGNFVGVILLFVTVLHVTRPTTVEEWFLIYPLWLVLVGLHILFDGRQLGRSLCHSRRVLSAGDPCPIVSLLYAAGGGSADVSQHDHRWADLAAGGARGPFAVRFLAESGQLLLAGCIWSGYAIPPCPRQPARADSTLFPCVPRRRQPPRKILGIPCLNGRIGLLGKVGTHARG
jgi:serine/threonine protein kinase